MVKICKTAITIKISQNFERENEICKLPANDQIRDEIEKNSGDLLHHIAENTMAIIALIGMAYINIFHVSNGKTIISNKKKRNVATSQAPQMERRVIIVLFLVVKMRRRGFGAIISFTVSPKILAIWAVTVRSGRPSPRSHLDIDLSE